MVVIVFDIYVVDVVVFLDLDVPVSLVLDHRRGGLGDVIEAPDLEPVCFSVVYRARGVEGLRIGCDETEVVLTDQA